MKKPTKDCASCDQGLSFAAKRHAFFQEAKPVGYALNPLTNCGAGPQHAAANVASTARSAISE
jgi:hypothetical protein